MWVAEQDKNSIVYRFIIISSGEYYQRALLLPSLNLNVRKIFVWKTSTITAYFSLHFLHLLLARQLSIFLPLRDVLNFAWQWKRQQKRKWFYRNILPVLSFSWVQSSFYIFLFDDIAQYTTAMEEKSANVFRLLVLLLLLCLRVFGISCIIRDNTYRIKCAVHSCTCEINPTFFVLLAKWLCIFDFPLSHIAGVIGAKETVRASEWARGHAKSKRKKAHSEERGNKAKSNYEYWLW